jgi:hypothetical protein
MGGGRGGGGGGKPCEAFISRPRPLIRDDGAIASRSGGGKRAARRTRYRRAEASDMKVALSLE